MKEINFPNDIDTWLSEGNNPAYSEYLTGQREEINHFFEDLGIPLDSEIAHFYRHYGASSFRGWYGLNDLDQFEDMIDYSKEELGVSEDYLPLSSIEGEGVTFYQKCTGAVFDVEFGQFEAFEKGELAPIAKSFVGFLSWAKQEDESGS